MKKTKQEDSNKILAELSKYTKTDEGKKLLVVGIIGILIGILWKVAIIALVIMGLGFFVV